MKKQRDKAQKLEVVDRKESPAQELISFETFFARCVRLKKLSFWQHDEVATFFRDCRLKEKETSDTYEATLKRY